MNFSSYSESFRCGVFFAGKPNEKPRLKIFVVPKRFRADCSAPEPEVYSNRCYSLVYRILQKRSHKRLIIYFYSGSSTNSSAVLHGSLPAAVARTRTRWETTSASSSTRRPTTPTGRRFPTRLSSEDCRYFSEFSPAIKYFYTGFFPSVSRWASITTTVGRLSGRTPA